MKLFYYTLLGLLLLDIGINVVSAQQNPIFHQYTFNPELYNPARAGENGGSSLFFIHRQQWMNINQAPTSQLFSFSQRLPNESPLALGLVVKNDRAALLQRTDAALFQVII